MVPSKVMVLGATGPAGLCVLRELLFRNYSVVAYVRSPNKIPHDLSASPLLSIAQGTMDDLPTFTAALRGCSAIISQLGPNIKDTHISPTLYSDMFRNTVIPAMRTAGVKRIILMGTLSIQRPEDSFTFIRPLILAYMNLFARPLLANLLNTVAFLEKEAQDIDWTMFRIAAIPGDADEDSWRAGREEGELFVGPVGAKGWTMNTNRGRLARWLVDQVEKEEWVRGLPAVSRLAGS